MEVGNALYYFPNNHYVKEIRKTRFVHDKGRHRQQSELILAFIQSLSEWELRKLSTVVYQIGGIRYEYIKRVHNLKAA